MRKPAFCICENKDADQLRGNREADQRLCFRYTYRTIPMTCLLESIDVKPVSQCYSSGNKELASLIHNYFCIVLK